MSDTLAKPSRWIGRCIIAISAIHTLLAAVMFAPIVQQMAADGIYNSVGEDPMRGAVTWFFFAGFLMALLGMAVDLLEKHGAGRAMKTLGVTLLVFCILGIILMPVSGFWLMLIPAAAMIWNSRRG